jgi:hypothetical protein
MVLSRQKCLAPLVVQLCQIPGFALIHGCVTILPVFTRPIKDMLSLRRPSKGLWAISWQNICQATAYAGRLAAPRSLKSPSLAVP